MPFVDDQITGPMRAMPEQAPESESAGFVDTMAAAFRTENTIGSALARDPDIPTREDAGFGLDPEYDPFADLHGYEDQASSFIYADTPDDVSRIKAQIDRERDDRETLASAGAGGFAAAMAAGILDPLILIPVGGQVRVGAKALEIGAKTALAGGAAAAVTEAALHATQETRTAAESAIAVGGATVLSGLMGAGFSKLSGSLSDRAAALEKDLTPPPMTESDPLAPSWAESSVGARAVRSTTMDQETVANAFGMDRATAFMTPMTRLLRSGSLEARRTVQELIDIPLFMTKNDEGIASPISVETKIRFFEANIGNARAETTRLFVQHRKGVADGGRLQSIGVNVGDAVRRNTGGRGLRENEFLAEVGRAMRREDQHDVPEVAEAAKKWRETVFEPIKDDAIKAGLLPEDVEVDTALSYFTRLYRYDKIINQRADFRQRLVTYLTRIRDEVAGKLEESRGDLGAALSRAERANDPEAIAKVQKRLEKVQESASIGRALDDELSDMADQIIDNILATPTGRTAHEATKLARGPLKERTLHIPDEEIEDFLVSDVDIVARHYIRSTAADVELAKMFNSPDLDAPLTRIREEYARRIANTTGEAEGRKLAKQRDADLKDMIALRDRLRGTYAAPADPTNVFTRSSRAARNWNFVRLLGGVAISSIPDIGRTVMSAGLYNTFKSGVVPMVSNWKALKLATAEAKLAGTAWELVLDSRAFGLGDIGDDFGRHSDTKIERGLQAFADSFGLVSLMSPWTQAMKTFASAVIGTKMLDATARVAAGKGTKAEIRNLASVGIDEFLAGKIAQQFRTHGRKEGTVKIADTLAWTDREAIEAFRGALQKEVEIAIVTPGAGDKPLWMSHELGKLIGQFRSFAFASTQRVFLRGLQQRDMATLNGAALMWALGMGVYALKSKVAGIETSEDPKQWAVEGIDRSGLLGAIWDLNGIAEKMTAGVLGTSAITGKTLSRYQTRNAIGALLGPSFGLGADAFTMTSAAAKGEIKLSDIRAARRLLPLQNLFYIRGLLTYAQEEVGEAVDAK